MIISLSFFVSVTHSPSLPLSPSVCLSLSDKLGDSLFCRKCSHHTNCRLVYSRFNLIIASPAFNQPASACFMLKPHSKYRIDFDKRRLSRLSEKLSRHRRWHRKWGSNKTSGVVFFLLLNILSVSLFWQFASSLQEAKRSICLASSALRLLGFQTLKGPQGEQLLPLPLLKTDTYLLAYTCGGTDCLSLLLKKHAQIQS